MTSREYAPLAAVCDEAWLRRTFAPRPGELDRLDVDYEFEPPVRPH